MRALITGSDGFVGQWLNRHLMELGWDTVGFDGSSGEDIRSVELIRNTLDKIRPDAIFHLAAQAYVPESFANPVRTFDVNTIGSLNILEAVRQLGIKTTIHLAGTSEEYGDGDPSETAMLEPKSPYAIAKAAMDHLGQLYTRSYGLHVVVTRAFNHAGPGRGEMYAESSFAKQIVEIEYERRKVLQHGNLGSIRNYTDVRDIVRGYAMAINLPSGVYNICSKQNVSMKQMLQILTDKANVRIETEESAALFRPADFSFKKPNCKKFQKLTGWKPQIPLEQTLEEILIDWRGRLK